MRPLTASLRGLLIFLLLGLAPTAWSQPPAAPEALAGFATKLGLHDVAAFVEAVQAIRRSGRLPERYVGKDEARAHGWHGGGLCTAWPGHVIGGDVFHNFGTALPGAPGRTYREADLDATCRERGAKRLIFSNDGLLFVTIDHYKTFIPVP